ncbi:MAG: 1-phosphofructokinase family hexose kinase [Coriobacteriia bacterium]
MGDMIVTVTPNPAMDVFLHLDELHCGYINRVRRLVQQPGGKGVNVGLALHDLGSPVVATGFLGGNTGRHLEELLRDTGITSSFVYVDDDTRTNHIIIDARYGGQTQVIEPGPRVTDADIARLTERISRLLGECSFLVVAGSLPDGMAPSACASLGSLAKARDVRTVLYLHDSDLADAMGDGVYMARPDIRDRSTFMGFEVTEREGRAGLAKRLLERAQIAVVGTGFEALVADREGAWSVTGPACSVSGGTVRMDDFFLAGMLDRLAHGGSLREAAQEGMACVLAALSNAPAPRARKEDLAAHAERVEVLEVGRL